MKLSIIIPVYKVEKYLRACLDSIFKQTELNSEVEVIIVNDGSPDNCSEIIAEYNEKYPNVKVLTQQNQGLSAARNNGLKLASGEYVWFVDSDDWIEENAIDKILKKISGTNPDVIKIRAIEYFSEDKWHIRQNEFDESASSKGSDYGKDYMADTPVQFFIIKKYLLQSHNLYFYESILHEDNEFTPRLLWFARKVAFINTPLYYYRQNPDSITKIFNSKRSYDLVKVCNSLSGFMDTENIKDLDYEYYMAVNNFICLSLNNALNNIIKVSKEEQKLFDKHLSLHKKLLRHLKKSTIAKYRVEGYLFSVFSNYVRIYKLLLKFK